jgi:hypothetical protein
MQRVGLTLILACVLSACAAPSARVDPWSTARVEHWAPARVSSPMFESHPAFDPWTGDFYFVRSDKNFRGWRILYSRCTSQGWGEPAPTPFAGDGVEADPWFSADGAALYFISSRTTDGRKGGDLDIWRIARVRGGHWGTPVRLPEEINAGTTQWFPRPARDGWLYFGSNRPGGLGGNDIWRAREDAPGRWTVEDLGPSINTTGDEYEPLPSPDGRTLLVEADGAYYVSDRVRDGWSARTKLSANVNASGSEIGALYSPSGRSLMFARDTGEPQSGEFFVLRFGDERWPPACAGDR